MFIDHSHTVNGRYMAKEKVLVSADDGIDNPSDAIIPAGTSLYRAGHSAIKGDPLRPLAAIESPWWSMYYDFNAAVWASGEDFGHLPDAARRAFAIHPAWGSDCTRFASIVTKYDLSVWYGIGKSVWGEDPATGRKTRWNASQDILQIYIPGFREHARQWSEQRHVYRVGESVSNGEGCQAVVPMAMRYARTMPVVQVQGGIKYHDLR